MAKKKKESIRTATFRPNSANAREDFEVPADIAEKLFEEGIIGQDVTNGGYCPLPTYAYDMKQHRVKP